MKTGVAQSPGQALTGEAPLLGHHPTQTKYLWFDPRSGHMPGLWAKFSTQGLREATDRCFSHVWMSLSLPSPLSKSKQIVPYKKERKRKLQLPSPQTQHAAALYHGARSIVGRRTPSKARPTQSEGTGEGGTETPFMTSQSTGPSATAYSLH